MSALAAWRNVVAVGDRFSREDDETHDLGVIRYLLRRQTDLGVAAKCCAVSKTVGRGFESLRPCY